MSIPAWVEMEGLGETAVTRTTAKCNPQLPCRFSLRSKESKQSQEPLLPIDVRRDSLVEDSLAKVFDWDH